MKEIKFRAWDEEKKKFWYVDLYDEVLAIGHPEANEESFDHLMQYTGLKDRHGVEIYEGDVVEMTNPDYVVPAGPYSDMVVRCGDRREVRSLESGFTLTHINSSTKHIPNIAGHVDNYNFWNMHRCFEVIGNIYENPELLEDEK